MRFIHVKIAVKKRSISFFSEGGGIIFKICSRIREEFRVCREAEVFLPDYLYTKNNTPLYIF